MLLQVNMETNMELELIFCIDCECEIFVSKMQKRTLRCKECKVKRQAFLTREAEKIRTAKHSNTKGKKCSCGCGRPKDPNLRMLSRYCFQRYSGRFGDEDEGLIYDDYKGGQGGER